MCLIDSLRKHDNNVKHSLNRHLSFHCHRFFNGGCKPFLLSSYRVLILIHRYNVKLRHRALQGRSGCRIIGEAFVLEWTRRHLSQWWGWSQRWRRICVLLVGTEIDKPGERCMMAPSIIQAQNEITILGGLSIWVHFNATCLYCHVG